MPVGLPSPSRCKLFLPVRWILVALSLLILAGTAFAAPKSGHRPSGRELRAELRFAAEMAEKGLWREAMFRWRRVLEARPGDPRLLNNVAVALEALGRFEEALDLYRQALDAAGGDAPKIRANYERARWARETSRGDTTPRGGGAEE